MKTEEMEEQLIQLSPGDPTCSPKQVSNTERSREES